MNESEKVADKLKENRGSKAVVRTMPPKIQILKTMTR